MRDDATPPSSKDLVWNRWEIDSMVYKISGHESSSSASSSVADIEEQASLGLPPPKTEYIDIPAPVTPVKELLYLKPDEREIKWQKNH